MLFILVASLLYLYTIQSNKPYVVDITPEENMRTFNPNAQKTSKPTKIKQKDPLTQEENDLDFLNEKIDWYPSDILNEENNLENEYDEIIFYDDFDKEYWYGTEDNYLEE